MNKAVNNSDDADMRDDANMAFGAGQDDNFVGDEDIRQQMEKGYAEDVD